MAGLAWAVETRGLIIIPPVMVLVSLGIWRGRSTDRRRMALVAIAAMAMGLGLREVLVQKQLQEWEHTEEYREELIDRQRRVVHRWIGSSPVLSQGICGQVPQDALLSMDFLTGPCPRQLIQDNFTRQLPPHLALGFGLTLLSALLTLLPGRRGRAASVDSAVLVFGAGAGLLFVAGLTPMPRRYIFQWTALLAMVGAAGPSRLAETLGGTQRRWLQPLVASALLGWMLLGGIKGQATPTIAPLGQHYQRYVDAQQSVLQHLQPGDGLMDCSANYVELSLLPRRTQPDHPTREPRSDYCQKWIEAPSSVSGQAWVLIKTPTVGQISGESGTEQPRPGSMKGVDLRENIAVAGTWEKVLQDDLWELWRHGD
jgi:hypothetical protein